jgi:hypothetical protein
MRSRSCTISGRHNWKRRRMLVQLVDVEDLCSMVMAMGIGRRFGLFREAMEVDCLHGLL